jgi:hypothetical protein
MPIFPVNLAPGATLNKVGGLMPPFFHLKVDIEGNFPVDIQVPQRQRHIAFRHFQTGGDKDLTGV